MIMNVKCYRDLIVWQKAVEFAVSCYKICQQFPKSETYGLSSQLQRASVSIPANIAEGAGRDYTKEFIRHLSIAKGSLFECETHLVIAHRIGYLNESDQNQLFTISAEIGRMIHGLTLSLERKLT